MAIDWNISGNYKTSSFTEHRGRNTPKQVCLGPKHRQTLVFSAIKASQKLPLVSEGAGVSRHTWTGCLESVWQEARKAVFTKYQPRICFMTTDRKPLITGSWAWQGPSDHARICLFLRAQEGFPPTSCAHQHQWDPTWEATNGWNRWGPSCYEMCANGTFPRIRAFLSSCAMEEFLKTLQSLHHQSSVWFGAK